MTFSRYNRTPRLNLGAQQGTSAAIVAIRSAMKDGRLSTRQIIVRGAERLDTIAGETYGNAGYWWILAACSDVGWGLQVPPGTVINVPELSAVASIVG